MSEATIAAGLRDEIAALADFEENSVVINSWHFMDQSTDFEPFCRIETGGLARWFYETGCPTYIWQIPVVIVKPFVEWDQTAAGLAALRTAIVARIETINYKSVLGAGVDIVEIRDQDPNAPIGVVIDPYIDAGQNDTTPTYLALPLLFTIEERI